MSSPQYHGRESVEDLAITLEHIGRILHSAGFAAGLHSVQWSALRYVSRAKPALCTVNGLAGYQGTTAAPASRTVAALIRKGYLVSIVNPSDRRSRCLRLTAAGHAMLKQDPLHILDAAIAGIAPAQREMVQGTLDHILETLLVNLADRQFEADDLDLAG